MNREQLQNQLAQFEREEQELIVRIHELHGARKMCQHWLAQLDQEESPERGNGVVRARPAEV